MLAGLGRFMILVFLRIHLSMKLAVHERFFPIGLSKVITNVVVPPIILGDSAYGLTNWLMRPFTDRGNLTNEEVAFNTAQSKQG